MLYYSILENLLFSQLSDFSMDLRACVWVNPNDDAFVLQCDVLETVKKRFDKEGIEIPYPHLTIVEKRRK